MAAALGQHRTAHQIGGLMMAFDVMGYLTFKVDNLIVGWYLGAAMLGFYDKAYQFLLMPVTQITIPLSNVVHATLSRLQTEPERFRVYLERALLLATSLGMPLTAFLYGNAATIIEQLLGARWLPSLPSSRHCASGVHHDDDLMRRLDFPFPRSSQAPAAMDRRGNGGDSGRISGGGALGCCGGRGGVQHRASGIVGTDAALYVCGHEPEDLEPAGHGGPPGIREHRSVDDLDVRHGRIDSVRVDAARNALIFGAVYSAFWMLIPGGRILMRENLQLAASLAK